MLNRFVAILTLLLIIPPLAAQEVEWSIDASILLSNREGGDEYSPDQTFFFTRLAPEIGLSLMDDQHVLKGGVVWYQPMIDDMSGYKILPTIYYRYNRDDGWHVTAGLLPRTLMVERMPRYLWSDSLAYLQPNIRGVMAQLIKPAGYAEIAVDWRQMQTEQDREAFTAMLNTDWKVSGPLKLGGHVQYSHLAMSGAHLPDEHVNDDLVINPIVSIDLSHRTALDSLRFSAGSIIALERNRGEDKWINHAGLITTATAKWHWLQLDETFYAGKDMMPLYPAYGSRLNLGDPYYHNKIYSRTDLTFHVVSNRFVDLTGSLTLHATDNNCGFWQQISCRFYIDNHMWKRRHDRHYLESGRLQQFY